MSKLNGVKTVDMVNGAITKVSYDGAEYVKVDGMALKGDIAEVVKPWGSQEEGAFYSVIQEDHHLYHLESDRDNFVHLFGGNIEARAEYDYFNIFRKVSAKPSQLRVGDTIKVSIPKGQRPAYGWGWVENGDVGKVISVNGGDVFVEFPTHSIWNGRLTELVKVAEDGYVRVTDRKPKAGDYVKFSEDGYDVTAGIYYEVTAIDEAGDAEFIDDAGDENSAVVDYETFEVYELVGTKLETLRVGDYAKVVNYRLRNGNIVEIAETDRQSDLGFTFRAKGVIDAYYDVFSPNQLVKATDAEVASAMKEHAEAKLAEQFAKLGRKPNEFKKGDIAKVIDSPSASPNGTLIEIMAVYDEYVIGRGWCAYLDKVTTYGYGLNGHIELIAPVESRVDAR